MEEAAPGSLKGRIDAIEAAYEFMLAYAAQGHRTEDTAPESVRQYMDNAVKALDGLHDAAVAAGGDGPAWADYLGMLRADAERALVALRFVLAQPSIGSQLVDNLNASLHLRTLLTDLFILDEATEAAKRA